MAFDYDLFVIGAGSGGVRASRIAAGHGARVGICEDYRVGGTCVIRGCVPKKLLVYGSKYAHEFEDSAAYGWTLASRPSTRWATLRDNVNRGGRSAERGLLRLLDGAGVKLHMGRGRLMDRHTIEVGGETITAEKILVATGGRPEVPPIPGHEFAITSNEAFHLPDPLPKRITIVGGGYIAVEFAGIFHGLGCEVDIVIRRDRVLRGFDEECRTFVHESLKASGIRMRTETEIERIMATRWQGAVPAVHAARRHVRDRPGDVCDRPRAEHARASGWRRSACSSTRWARSRSTNGRRPRSRTSGPSATSPTASTSRRWRSWKGHCFADTEFGNKPRKADHRNVPSAVFCQPEMANVGLTEEEARQTLGELRVYASAFTPMKYTLAGRKQRTFMKLIVEAATDRVVGCHMVGDDAAELIQGLAVAVKAGATKAQFDATVGIHPTAGEEFVTMRTARPEPTAKRAAAE